MPLDWDNEEEDEEVTVIEYRKRPQNKVIVHEEVTVPLTAEEAKSEAPPRPRIKKTLTPPPEMRGPELAPGESVASPQERFTAFCIDSLVVFYLYWLIGGLLNWIFQAPSLLALHQQTTGWVLHLGLTFFLAMFYYTFFESSSGATWGKMFCGLKVVDASGHKPSFGNAVIRNIMRIMDYQLFFLVAVILMESSRLHQRLGDRAAQTLVIKTPKAKASPYNLKTISLGSTFSRVLAELIDLSLAFTLAYGCTLIPSFRSPISYPTFAYTILISGPIVFLSYYILLEALIKTTPGKLLFKRQVIKDNGETLDTSAAFIRNLFRPVDYFIGYILLALTPRKQRLGDLAANTIVVAKENNKNAILGSLIAVFFVIVVAFFGFRNPHSYIRETFNTGPINGFIQLFKTSPVNQRTKQIPQIISSESKSQIKDKKNTKTPQTTSNQPTTNQTKNSQNPWVKQNKNTQEEIKEENIPISTAPESWGNELEVTDFGFGIGPLPHHNRPDAQFKTNERIFAKLSLRGAQLNDRGQYSITQGFKVLDSQGNTLIDRPTAVRRPGKPDPKKSSIDISNYLKQYEAGTYQVIFEITDTISGKSISLEKSFTVNP